ncbi:MAG TPA: zf-HC2 domain-containing protein [Chloroflexia bacterium]|jgi:hypothetical protein
MGKDRNNNIHGEHVIGLISSYIDNALDAGDRERVRAHIDGCEVCGAEYRELRATQQMLRAMPVQVPPRVFTLTEEMVGARSGARPSLLSRLLSRALAPRLATGSVLAFALLLVMLVSDLGVLNRSLTAVNSAPGARAVENTSPLMLAAPTSTTAMLYEARPVTADASPTTASAALYPTEVAGAAGGADQSAPANPASPLATPENMAPTATTASEAPSEKYADTAQPTPVADATQQSSYYVVEGTPSTGVVERFNLQAPDGLTDTDTGASGEAALAQSFDSGSGSFPVTLAIEIGLALLAVGLAIAALVARRRSA